MAILCKIAHPSRLEEKVEASLEGVQVVQLPYSEQLKKWDAEKAKDFLGQKIAA